jgi:hypothetical protein
MAEHLQEELPVLVGQTGPYNGQRWSLEHSLLVGREKSCEIAIPDRQVSRQHLRFSPTSEGVYAEDLGSRNGTHHNGKPLQERVLLQDGDVLHVALAQQFMFLASDATIPLDLTSVEDVPAQGGRLKLDKRSRRIWVNRTELVPPLSVAQFRLLELMYENDQEVVSRQALIEQVWGAEQAYDISNQALDALVRRLRDRLAEADPDHSYIVTVRGHGLRLDNPAE